MRDQPVMKDFFYSNMSLHFYLQGKTTCHIRPLSVVLWLVSRCRLQCIYNKKGLIHTNLVALTPNEKPLWHLCGKPNFFSSQSTLFAHIPRTCIVWNNNPNLYRSTYLHFHDFLYFVSFFHSTCTSCTTFS